MHWISLLSKRNIEVCLDGEPKKTSLIDKRPPFPVPFESKRRPPGLFFPLVCLHGGKSLISKNNQKYILKSRLQQSMMSHLRRFYWTLAISSICQRESMIVGRRYSWWTWLNTLGGLWCTTSQKLLCICWGKDPSFMIISFTSLVYNG